MLMMYPEDDNNRRHQVALAGARTRCGTHHALIRFYTPNRIPIAVVEIVACSVLMDESFEDAKRRIANEVEETIPANHLNFAKSIAERLSCKCPE